MRARRKEPKDDKWKAKYKGPAAQDTSDLPELPKGWGWITAEQVCEASGPQNGLYLPKSKYGSGTPILRIDDFQQTWSRSSDELQRVAAAEGVIAMYSLAAEEVLINRVNSPSHLGKCMVVEQRHVPALFESNMMRVATLPGMDSRFLVLWLRTSTGRRLLLSGAKWAVNQASINQQDVLSTPIPLPPAAEQERIVAEVERRLSVVEKLEEAVDHSLKRAERLRQAILKRAFEGRLVLQDPSDEPASVLLERIQDGRVSNSGRRRTHAARR